MPGHFNATFRRKPSALAKLQDRITPMGGLAQLQHCFQKFAAEALAFFSPASHPTEAVTVSAEKFPLGPCHRNAAGRTITYAGQAGTDIK